MKARINKVYTIALGVIVAICLLAGTFNTSNGTINTTTEKDIFMKYKSSIPLVAAPLQILARGLNIINKDKGN